MVGRYLDCRLVKVNAGYAYALAFMLPVWRMKLLGHEISVAKLLWQETAVAKAPR
jgi:hypothetical protein